VMQGRSSTPFSVAPFYPQQAQPQDLPNPGANKTLRQPGHYARNGSSPVQKASRSSPLLSIELKATPIQPVSTPVWSLSGQAALSPKLPQPATTHLVTRELRRTALSPLEINIFCGPLEDFLEEHGSDVVLTSSFKSAFRTVDAASSFCSVAQKCGINVSTLQYNDFIPAGYDLHMLEPQKYCGSLWLVELKTSSPFAPFKSKHLVECYNMLKQHSRKIIQETTDTLTLPLIGKGSKANYFQVGRNEVIVELVGFLHWIAENMNDRPNLSTINIVSYNRSTAQALLSAFDLLIPVQLGRFDEFLKPALIRSTNVLEQFEEELKNLEQAEREERQLNKGGNESGVEDRQARVAKRVKRMKLDGIVQKLRLVGKAVENIRVALQASNNIQEMSIIIVSCAVNGRIVAELCSELFLLEDGLFHRKDAAASPQKEAKRHEQFSPGSSNGETQDKSARPPSTFEDLYARMIELKASGKASKEIYHHFQTLRFIGSKAVHSNVLRATTVDIGAIVLAVYGLVMSSHF